MGMYTEGWTHRFMVEAVHRNGQVFWFGAEGMTRKEAEQMADEVERSHGRLVGTRLVWAPEFKKNLVQMALLGLVLAVLMAAMVLL